MADGRIPANGVASMRVAAAAACRVVWTSHAIADDDAGGDIREKQRRAAKAHEEA